MPKDEQAFLEKTTDINVVLGVALFNEKNKAKPVEVKNEKSKTFDVSKIPSPGMLYLLAHGNSLKN